MLKFLKFIISVAVLLLIAGGGFVVYRLWDQGELTKENLNTDTMGDLLTKEAKKLGDDVKEGSLALKDKIQNEWIDWDELKGNWTLSEEELESFTKDLAFLNETSSSILGTESEKPGVPEVTTTSPAKPSSPPPVSSKPTTTSKPEQKEEPAKPTVVKKQPPKAPKAPSSPYPNLVKSRSYKQGMADLEKAKEYNRKGLPGKPNAKANLKKAVTYYKKSQKQILSVQRSSGLNAKEKKHLDGLMEEISKQIYWGSKLGSL